MDFDIPKDYFLDEVRDGFFVPSMIKKSWASSIMDYKILEEICDKLGLNIYFMFGSLIAIVRHAGSIPWDDDIDSMMLHSEYNKLIEFFANNGTPENYAMKDYSDMGNGNLVRKWTDNATAVKNVERWKESFGFPFINNVDVMMLDNLPDGDEEMQHYRDVTYLLQYLKDIADMIESGNDDYDKKDFDYSMSLIERLMDIRYDSEKDGKLSVWVWKLLDVFTAKYDQRSGKYVASFSHYLRNGNGKFERKFFSDFVDMPYEFTSVKVPIGYDRVLRDFFGDYMTPRLEWDGHVYPFYKDLEKALIEKYDTELLRYHYREEEIKRVMYEKDTSVCFSDVLKSSINLFREAHEYIYDSLEGNDSLSDDIIQVVSEIIGSCQELSMNIGTVTESRLIDELEIKRIIKRLEEYCEFIFGIYSDLGELRHLDLERIRSLFSDFEMFLVEESEKEFAEKIKVLFLCVRREDWQSLHSIWEAAVTDKDTDVKVIAVPYYIKDGSGMISRDDIQIDSIPFPDTAEVIPYDQYDFKTEHPDVVIYQSPYDSYSDAMTIHPYYYIENIRKYAEKLVFIPPFSIREITDGDERSKYAIGCFVCNPGTVYADMVVVQSESMKNVYVSILNRMVNRDLVYQNEEWKPKEGIVDAEDMHDLDVYNSKYENYTPTDKMVAKCIDWEDKIIPLGTAITDWNDRNRVLLCDDGSNTLYNKEGIVVSASRYDTIVDVPADWIKKIKKEDGSFRKILLFHISSSVAFEYGSDIFIKAKAVLDLVKKNHMNELIVLYSVDRNYRRVLRKNDSSAWTACQSFLEYVKGSCHILDDTNDIKRAALICDACYGDGSYVMNLCREYGKPVMIQDPNIGLNVE